LSPTLFDFGVFTVTLDQIINAAIRIINAAIRMINAAILPPWLFVFCSKWCRVRTMQNHS